MPATKAQLALIDSAYASLPDLERGFTNFKDRLVQMCLESEKQHRRGRCTLARFSAVKAAKYFAVKWLLDGVRSTKAPRLSDALRIRPEVFYAYAIVDDDYLKPALTLWEANNDGMLAEFANLDYVEMIS